MNEYSNSCEFVKLLKTAFSDLNRMFSHIFVSQNSMIKHEVSTLL